MRFWTISMVAVLAVGLGGCGTSGSSEPEDSVDADATGAPGDSSGDAPPATTVGDTPDVPTGQDTATSEDVATPSDQPRVRGEADDEVAFIYDPAELRTFELLISEDNMAFLDAKPSAEMYVKGTLVFEGEAYENVAIRYKGSAGAWIFCTSNSTPANPWDFSGSKTCPKLSFRVSFNKYDPEGRFFGVKKLLFHAMNQDPSMMRERLAYHLFRVMDVPAPRAVHVRLLINGELAGLYANVEHIDGRFTRSRFSDGEGNLYKEVWPTWNYLTPPLTEARLMEGLKTNEDENPSVEKMLAFGQAMQGDPEAQAQAVQDWMSVDNTQRFIAVDRTIRADDGPFHFYCSEEGCSNHNFYVYEEEDQDRLYLIPWDLDHAFTVLSGDLGGGADEFLKVVDEWHDATIPCVAHAGAGAYAPWQMPPSCDPLFNACGSALKGIYDDAVVEFVEGPFSEDEVNGLLEAWTDQIGDAVAEAYEADPKQIGGWEWLQGLADLNARIDHLRAQATIAQ